MIVDFKLPLVTPHMSEAVIECVHAAPDSALDTGAKLLDLSVDLSGSFEQNCPPISFFRIIVREHVVLRALLVRPGQSYRLGDTLALFTTTDDESAGTAPQRGVRVAVAGIMHHRDMWTGNIR